MQYNHDVDNYYGILYYCSSLFYNAVLILFYICSLAGTLKIIDSVLWGGGGGGGGGGGVDRDYHIVHMVCMYTSSYGNKEFRVQ